MSDNRNGCGCLWVLVILAVAWVGFMVGVFWLTGGLHW